MSNLIKLAVLCKALEIPPGAAANLNTHQLTAIVEAVVTQAKQAEQLQRENKKLKETITKLDLIAYQAPPTACPHK